MLESFNTTDNTIHSLIYERNRESEIHKTAEIKALQAQIMPHFLYNTLNSIGVLAKRYGAKDIEKMTVIPFFDISQLTFIFAINRELSAREANMCVLKLIVQRICNEVVVHLSMCLVQCGQNPDVLFNKTDVWTVIRKYNTVDSLEKYISDIAEVTVSHITFSRTTKNCSLIEQVQKYIQDNPSASLNDISAHFYHSPNYLSNIFSKEAGITIKNYIINTRIERSKQLLTETEDSICEIANAVGYKNPQHFSVLFKKKVGTTPSVYKNGQHTE